jgi:putative transposon-encoded protein
MTTTTNAVVIPDKLIKPHGNTAHVYIPKKYLGKRATVIIHLDDEKRGKIFL